VRAAEPTSEVTPPTQKVVHQAGIDKVAVVYMDGVIMDDFSEGGFGATGGVSAKKMKTLFDYLDKTDEVKAVVLRINSPGGAVVASDDIARRVKELKSKKPIVTSMGDTAASGGYYIAANSNKIVANPSTITGSIGVIAQFPKLSGLYDKLGIEMRTFKSGEFKDIGSATKTLSKEEEIILNSVITDSYDQFVQTVAAGRQMDEAKVRQLADGRIYTGKQALDKGLVDKLGNLDDSIELAASLAGVKDPTVVEYSTQSFIESLFSSAIQVSPLQSIKEVLPNKSGVYYLWGM
jgi:protease-4